MILDDLFRIIVASKKCMMMKAADVTETIGMTLMASRQDGNRHRPRPLPDNGRVFSCAFNHATIQL